MPTTLPKRNPRQCQSQLRHRLLRQIFSLGNCFRQLKRGHTFTVIAELISQTIKAQSGSSAQPLSTPCQLESGSVSAASVEPSTSGIPCFFGECWIAIGRTSSSDRCRLAASEQQSRRLRVYGFETMLNLVYSQHRGNAFPRSRAAR